MTVWTGKEGGYIPQSQENKMKKDSLCSKGIYDYDKPIKVKIKGRKTSKMYSLHKPRQPKNKAISNSNLNIYLHQERL